MLCLSETLLKRLIVFPRQLVQLAIDRHPTVKVRLEQLLHTLNTHLAAIEKHEKQVCETPHPYLAIFFKLMTSHVKVTSMCQIKLGFSSHYIGCDSICIEIAAIVQPRSFARHPN